MSTANSNPLRAGDVLLAALGFGLTAGLIEGVAVMAQEHLLGMQTMMGPGVLWMAPFMDLLWLVIPGLLMAALLLVWRSPRATWLAVFGIALPAAVAITFVAVVKLHTYALLLLALGIAVQVASFAARNPDRFRRLARVATPASLLLTLLMFGAVEGYAIWREKKAVAALPEATAGAPNVLLLILDTVRSMSTSLDGYDRPTTPRIEAFAGRGVHFRQALAPSSWTLPSHASMFTGYLPHQLSSGLRTPLDRARPLLAEALAGNGYVTAGFIANLHYVSRDYGLARGFHHYSDYVVGPGELFLNSSVGRYLAVDNRFRRMIGYYDIIGRKHAGRVNRDLLDWLEDRPEGRPFFAFINYYDAHEPYLPPPRFDSLFASPTPRKPYLTDQSLRGARRVVKQRMTPAEVQREREAYAASIAALDHEIGNLLDSLEARGVLRNTLVIITSDHGEQFGSHGLFVHGNSLYQPLLHVPLVMVLPDTIPAGVRVDEALNLRDVAQTVLDLTHTAPAVPFPGASLRRFWTRDSHLPEPLLFEVITNGSGAPAEELRSVVWDDLKYIRHENGKEELYDLEGDPKETRNLLALGRDTAVMPGLRAMMDSLLAATGEDRWGE